jgi:hypothetical protein
MQPQPPPRLRMGDAELVVVVHLAQVLGVVWSNDVRARSNHPRLHIAAPKQRVYDVRFHPAPVGTNVGIPPFLRRVLNENSLAGLVALHDPHEVNAVCPASIESFAEGPAVRATLKQYG